jgi:hypothetical protein
MDHEGHEDYRAERDKHLANIGKCQRVAIAQFGKLITGAT